MFAKGLRVIFLLTSCVWGRTLNDKCESYYPGAGWNGIWLFPPAPVAPQINTTWLYGACWEGEINKVVDYYLHFNWDGLRGGLYRQIQELWGKQDIRALTPEASLLYTLSLSLSLSLAESNGLWGTPIEESDASTSWRMKPRVDLILYIRNTSRFDLRFCEQVIFCLHSVHGIQILN